MNASKEECRKAIAALEDLKTNLNGEVRGGIANAVDKDLNTINSFLTAAEKKLPSEASFDKDKNRKDVEDAAKVGFSSDQDPSESIGKGNKRSRL